MSEWVKYSSNFPPLLSYACCISLQTLLCIEVSLDLCRSFCLGRTSSAERGKVSSRRRRPTPQLLETENRKGENLPTLFYPTFWWQFSFLSDRLWNNTSLSLWIMYYKGEKLIINISPRCTNGKVKGRVVSSIIMMQNWMIWTKFFWASKTRSYRDILCTKFKYHNDQWRRISKMRK